MRLSLTTALLVLVSMASAAPTTAPATTQAALRRVHVIVTGRVQGVGFRAFTQHEARKLDLAGWVRNLDDGSVEAVIEGPEKKVAEVLVAINRGPLGSRVDKVRVADEPYKGELRGFRVR